MAPDALGSPSDLREAGVPWAVPHTRLALGKNVCAEIYIRNAQHMDRWLS